MDITFAAACFVLTDSKISMRASARALGCSVQAISEAAKLIRTDLEASYFNRGRWRQRLQRIKPCL